MKLTRKQILTVGPVLLVATCYAIAAPSRSQSSQAAVSIIDDAATEDRDPQEPLTVRCAAAAKSLQDRLVANWKFIVREPFVLGGDLTEKELDASYQQTIAPTVRALAVSYFSNPPRHPTIILLCSSDERFRECNVQLDDQDRSQYSGLYSRKHRRVVVNVASGEGTLAHELTHALAHADFPAMPEWFDEGLASLHEECEFSLDGLHLIGNDNWRNEVAQDALTRGELRLLEDITSKRFGSRDRAHVDYAHVRSMCLYLQERGLLEPFYRTCRANAANDPTGLRSLCQVADVTDPKAFDDAFHAWLITHQTATP